MTAISIITFYLLLPAIFVQKKNTIFLLFLPRSSPLFYELVLRLGLLDLIFSTKNCYKISFESNKYVKLEETDFRYGLLTLSLTLHFRAEQGFLRASVEPLPPLKERRLNASRPVTTS